MNRSNVVGHNSGQMRAVHGTFPQFPEPDNNQKIHSSL